MFAWLILISTLQKTRRQRGLGGSLFSICGVASIALPWACGGSRQGAGTAGTACGGNTAGTASLGRSVRGRSRAWGSRGGSEGSKGEGGGVLGAREASLLGGGGSLGWGRETRSFTQYH